MKLFNNIRKKEPISYPVFNKEQVINDILERRITDCPGWNFFRISNYDSLDMISGDFLAIYTDVINKEIKLKSNPFSEYKRTVESIYQIVREVYIIDDSIDCNLNEMYKRITAASPKELFIKLKNEV